MYRCVFLDWDDTIGDWQNVAKRAHRVMYQSYHLERWFATPEEWMEAHRAHNTILWEEYSKSLITKDFLYVDQFLYPLCQQMGIDTQHADDALRTMARSMGDDYVRLTNEFCQLIDGAAEVVRYLARRYPLTIVSNGFSECQSYKLEHSGLLPCFMHVVLSEDVGIQKPNPYIFEVALQRNGVSASEAVMIGDSWYSDINGAQQAGVDQIWVRPDTTTPPLATETATYILSSIREVPTLL